MGESRFLIVNADDLGLTAAVNTGIFEAHERGVVTSTSLMVERPAAIAAAEGLAEHPDLAVGLHLEPEDCRAQLERFRELVGREPTHIDSHKQAHEVEPVRAVAEALAAELRLPLRNRTVRYEGSFYGRPGGEPAPEAISPERQVELQALIDPRVKNLLNVSDVRLCSFAQVGAG